MTLREYISFWQETYDRHQSRPTTYAAHNYVFKNHILPGLGDTQLSELTSEMVGEFLEERKRFGNHRSGSSGLGEETMRHIHRLLQQCLDQAIRDGLLTKNPAKAFRYRKSTTVKANIVRQNSSINPESRAARAPCVRLSERKRVPVPTKGLRANLNRFQRSLRGQQGSRRSPAKRVRWEKEEQRNERFFALLGENEGCGACDDAKQDKGMASQAPPQPPLLPAVRAVSDA